MDRSRPAAARHRLAVLVPTSRRALLLIASLAALPTVAHALVPHVSACTPTNWSGPVVPTTVPNSVDSLAIAVPAVLLGDGATYLNWSSCGNPAAMGGWTDQLSLDGKPVQIVVRPWDTRWIAHLFRAVNQGPTIIGGGRHTLQVHADLYGTSGESLPGDYDNVWDGQWVWSPIGLNWGQSYFRGVPPEHGPGAFPNCDGLALNRPNGAAWCIGLASPGDDDLIVYDDYSGPTSGFSHALATAASPADSIEFVVGQGGGTPATLYPAIVSGSTAAPATCVLSTSDAATRTGGAASAWVGQRLPGYRIAEVFVVHLDAGNIVPMTLTRTGGTTPLSFGIFPAGAGGVYTRTQALNAAAVGPTSSVSLEFAPSVTGDYPVVVYRGTQAGLIDDVFYSLSMGGSLGVTEAPAAPALALAGASPNPVQGDSRFAFALPSAGHVTLALHDVQGRRVRTLVDAAMPAGAHDVAWDGRDDAGARVPAGSYWMKLVTADGTRTRAVIVAR